MKDYYRLLEKCYIKKCKEENIMVDKIRNEWMSNISKLINELQNKKITKKQFIAKNKKLDDNYYKSNENIKLLKCELDKCYENVKFVLHELSHKIKYTKKDIYTLKEYIKILRDHSYYNSTLIEFI